MKSKGDTELPPLNRYREKRRFDRTPEPAGDARAAPEEPLRRLAGILSRKHL